MGYEIVYRYKDSGDSPGSYSEEVKEKRVKIGKPTNDIGLEVLAPKIMAQLARRNILIIDVEIYEYAKKKISYRETKGGIVIKNKKFSFDSGVVVETDEEEEYDESSDSDSEFEFKPIPSPSKSLAENSCPLGSKGTQRRPIRYEIFDPEPLAESRAAQKGLKFTKGKKYPVHSESSMGTGVVYKTFDDTGREVQVGSEYFVVIGAGLVKQDDGPTYVGAEGQTEEVNLWGRYEHTEMPDVRRR